MSWTTADAAEQDVLTWELVNCYSQHRPSCRRCQAWLNRLTGATPCPHLAAAIEIVLDWRHKRHLLTTAEQLRLERRLLISSTP